jgi:hypothetical protein
MDRKLYQITRRDIFHEQNDYIYIFIMRTYTEFITVITWNN